MSSTHQGHHRLLAGAPPPTPATAPHGAAAGFDPRRTLRLRVELARQLRRRRVQLTLGFLVALPFLLVGAFTLGSDSEEGDQVPGLVDLATTGAANFTLFTLFAATGFLIVVVVALFSGDTVASEASWSSLRYLLAAPVPRARLLRQKLLVALGLSGFALVLLPAVALLAGGLAFGWAPARTPLGSTLGNLPALGRLGVVVGYLAVVMLVIAALGLTLSVYTDAPLGAVGGTVLLAILSNILDSVSALGDLRAALPTHYQYAWVDALGPEVDWDQMLRGASFSIGYSAVLLVLAWRHFLGKDIVS